MKERSPLSSPLQDHGIGWRHECAHLVLGRTRHPPPDSLHSFSHIAGGDRYTLGPAAAAAASSGMTAAEFLSFGRTCEVSGGDDGPDADSVHTCTPLTNERSTVRVSHSFPPSFATSTAPLAGWLSVADCHTYEGMEGVVVGHLQRRNGWTVVRRHTYVQRLHSNAARWLDDADCSLPGGRSSCSPSSSHNAHTDRPTMGCVGCHAAVSLPHHSTTMLR